MRKVLLKRGGWLLIATGAVVLAYHVGNLTSPSTHYEPTPYEAVDLAPPAPIAEESSLSEPQSPASNELTKARESYPRGRIISVTAIHGIDQSRRNFPAQPSMILLGQATRQ